MEQTGLAAAYSSLQAALSSFHPPYPSEPLEEAKNRLMQWAEGSSALPAANEQKARRILHATERAVAEDGGDEEGFEALVKELGDAVGRLEKLAQGDELGNDEDELSRLLSGLKVSPADEKRPARFLSSVSTLPEYQLSLTSLIPDTCLWILNTQEYTAWASTITTTPSAASILWIHGAPGCGKTCIASKITETLTSSSDPGVVAYFFCTHQDSAKRATSSILRSWISQLAAASPGAKREVERVLGEEEGVGGDADDDDMLWRIFESVLAAMSGICYLVVDGLDECLDYDQAARARTAGMRGMFLKRMLAAAAATAGVRVLVVSRDEPDIRRELGSPGGEGQQGRSLVVEYAISSQDTTADVVRFTHAIVSEKFGDQPAELKEMAEIIAARSDGVFSWARLASSYLHFYSTGENLRETLSSLPSGLAALHRRHLAKISNLAPGDRARAKEILRWVIFAERPLTVRELTEALTLQDADELFPTDRIPSPLDPNDQILRPCGGLVEVSRGGDPEHVGGWTVHLAHSSTKELLTADCSREERAELGELADLMFFDYQMNHGLLAKTCLSYLMLQDIESAAVSVDRHSPSQWPPPPASTIHQDPRLSSYALLSYAIQNWSSHVAQNTDYDAKRYPRTERVLTHPRKAQKEGILRPAYHSHSLHRVLASPLAQDSDDDLRPHNDALDPLSHVTRFGILAGVKLLLRGKDPKTHQDLYARALWTATFYHQTPIVHFLLSAGADANAASTGTIGEAADKFGSALHIAVKLGFADLAQVLLQHGADANAMGGEYGNVLNTAVARGSKRVVELLLSHGADIAAAPPKRGSALTLAAAMDKPRIAQALLDKGAPISAQHGRYGDALTVAATDGNLGMVKLLLDNGADVNAVGGFYGTPLQAAAARGHAEVVKLLVESGADGNVTAGYYGSALAAAREEGFAEVAGILEGGASAAG